MEPRRVRRCLRSRRFSKHRFSGIAAVLLGLLVSTFGPTADATRSNSGSEEGPVVTAEGLRWHLVMQGGDSLEGREPGPRGCDQEARDTARKLEQAALRPLEDRARLFHELAPPHRARSCIGCRLEHSGLSRTNWLELHIPHLLGHFALSEGDVQHFADPYHQWHGDATGKSEEVHGSGNSTSTGESVFRHYLGCLFGRVKREDESVLFDEKAANSVAELDEQLMGGLCPEEATPQSLEVSENARSRGVLLLVGGLTASQRSALLCRLFGSSLTSKVGSIDNEIELNLRMSVVLEAIAHTPLESRFVGLSPVRPRSQGQMPPCGDAATSTRIEATMKTRA